MMALLDVTEIFEGGCLVRGIMSQKPEGGDSVSSLSCCDKISQPKGFEEVRVYFGLQL